VLLALTACAPSHEKVRLRVSPGDGLAVMTFDDRTGRGDEAMGSQVAHQFASRLAINMGNVVEPHQMEALFAEAGKEVPRGRTAEAYESIREVTRCDVAVIGSVNELADGDGFDPPKAAVSIRLVDLASGYTLYARGKSLPDGSALTPNREAGYLLLRCADYLADRMAVDVAFAEGEFE
jgi:hypothetical protein